METENNTKRLEPFPALKTICTIGYAQKSAKDFFSLLTAAKVQIVVDIRENISYQVAGYTFPRDFVYFCELHQIKYVHLKKLAPSKEIRANYKRSKKWKEYYDTFIKHLGNIKALADEEVRKVLYGADETICFLCTEPTPEFCHRRIVAELIKHFSETPITVKHLTVDQKIPKEDK